MKRLSIIPFLYLFPIHEIPEILQIFRSPVPIIDIIGMFPDIAGEKRGIVGCERGSGIGGGYEIERSVRFFHEPSPSGTEGFHGHVVEGFFEHLYRLPFLEDQFLDIGSLQNIPSRSKTLPVEGMVPDLGGIIEDRSGWRCFDDLLEGCIFEFRSRNESIEVIYIGLMVLSIVVSDRFFGNIGLEPVKIVGERRKRV